MRFLELFEGARAPVISFEVYPPRTDKAREKLEGVVARLVALRPAYMTVTYGALGSTQAQTLDVAAKIRGDFKMETACHLTCVGASRDDIDAVLDRLRRADIENIVALRGDPPEGQAAFVAEEGGFSHANELVAHLRSSGGFGIAVAGYPEKHVEAPDMDTDLRYLEQKVEAGGDVIITQLFYDNADYFAFERRIREMGIRAPLVPGLLPIQSYGQIKKIASLCGARIPDELRHRMEAAGDEKGAVAEVGTQWATAQARELLERGASGIHFYVLNRAAHMERIMGVLREDGLL